MVQQFDVRRTRTSGAATVTRRETTPACNGTTVLGAIPMADTGSDRRAESVRVQVGVRYCVNHDGVANEDDEYCDFYRDEPDPCDLRQLWYEEPATEQFDGEVSRDADT
jgi:hypothetical protein